MVCTVKIIGAAFSLLACGACALTTPKHAAWGVSYNAGRPHATLPLQAIVSDAPTSELGLGSASPILIPPAINTSRKRGLGKEATSEINGQEEALLRIYNDGINTREYVSRCLVEVVGLCEERAFCTMMRAHSAGIAVVGEWRLEVAEMYEMELGGRGIKCDVISGNS